jgi:hypothetical protein
MSVQIDKRRHKNRAPGKLPGVNNRLIAQRRRLNDKPVFNREVSPKIRGFVDNPEIPEKNPLHCKNLSILKAFIFKSLAFKKPRF